jgi:hypothetical protein
MASLTRKGKLRTPENFPETGQPMKSFFARNLDKRGRVVRGLSALPLLLGAGLCDMVWLSGVLTGVGVFVLFEALRGWCVLRACGIKTSL